MTDEISIRPASETDYPQWKSLWQAYLTFYESVLPPESTERLWKRILDSSHPIRCNVAEVGVTCPRLRYQFLS